MARRSFLFNLAGSLKKGFILFLNFLPSKIKWVLFNLPIFNKKVKINFNKTRKKIIGVESKVLVIGANDGMSFDNLFDDLDKQKTHGVFIEPSSKYFNELKRNLEKFPNIIPLRIAISKEFSKLSLFQLNNNGLKKLPEWGSAIGSFNKEHLLKFNFIKEDDIEEEIVEGRPFMWLIEEFRLNFVDYLQIDTEGFDAEIIKMIDFKIFFASIIKFEIVHISDAEQEEVKSILAAQGYWLVRTGGDMVGYSKKVNPYFY